MATMQELAGALSEALIHKQRDAGNHEPGLDHYTVCKDGSPEWMTDACHAAHNHGDVLPDDWRYEFIADAAAALAEYDDADEAIEYFDGKHVYTHQQTGWLHSRNSRSEYVDQYREEMGGDGDTMALIAGGMYMEQREVLGELRAFLEGLAVRPESLPGGSDESFESAVAISPDMEQDS